MGTVKSKWRIIRTTTSVANVEMNAVKMATKVTMVKIMRIGYVTLGITMIKLIIKQIY